ncbi:hypothetical protein [Azospirillum sp. B2RO_4]|uniref:hypothetical protein n=1 Tax=Azospirillum sp. B2RO_4 TaxID=3027796 RepID=UPI003DA8C97A
MQLPAIVVYPDGTRVLFHSPASFTAPLLVAVQRPAENDDPDAPPEMVEVEEAQTITHPPEAWTLWTPADWAAMCPDLIVRPVVDPGAPVVAGKRAVRQQVEAWDIGNDVATVTYALVDLTPAEIAAQAANLKAQVAAAVQRHLDAAVSERNYASAAAAVSYVGDPNPRWDAEGRAVLAWRSAVWTACFAALDAVLAGKRPPLTPKEMVAELPPLVWPE